MRCAAWICGERENWMRNLTAYAGKPPRNPGWRRQILLTVCGAAAVALAGDGRTATSGAVAAASPIILYTDITSGPDSGGENDQGIYLSVFGRNFGSSLQGVRLLIGGVEVANYRYLGPSHGRPDIQQLSAQIGHLGNPAPGVAQPIQLFVSDKGSNTDLTFTVNPGHIYFVSPSGSDDSASAGTFEKPLKTLQKPAGVHLAFAIAPASVAGAYGLVRAGDFIVLRGGTYADVGLGAAGGAGYLLQTLNKSGCPLPTRCPQGGGASSGPITLMGYPGEAAFLDRTNRLGDKFGGGISSADSARQTLGYGAWWNIVDLKIESGFYDGAVNTQRADLNPLGGHWRVVNNELSADSCRITTCRAGAIAGAGIGQFWVGNYAHDVYDKPSGTSALENHGIYIGGPGSYEIAYNVFARIVGGNGIQIQSGQPVDNVSIHHNIIHDIGKHGLNLVTGSRDNIVIWSNLIYNTAYAGVRLGSDDLHDLKLYNNTFYNTGMMGDTPSSGALTNDMNAGNGQMDIRNNIFWPHPGSGYNRGAGNAEFSGAIGTVSHNLWYGGSGSDPAGTFSKYSLTADPRFASVIPGAEDFHLQPESPALGAGTGEATGVVTSDIELQPFAQPSGETATAGSFYIGAYAR
jgi:hypothetical protein